MICLLIASSLLLTLLTTSSKADSTIVEGATIEDIRLVIPEDAVNARKNLYKLWQLTEKDVCRYELHKIPISYLGLKRRGNDMEVGEFLSKAMEDGKEKLRRIIWKNWAVNHNEETDDISNIYETNLNQTLDHKLEFLSDRMLELFQEFLQDELGKILLHYTPKFQPNLVNKDHLMHAIAGLVQMKKMNFDEKFTKVMDTEGISNLGPDNVKEITEKLFHGFGAGEVISTIKSLREKIKSVIIRTSPFTKGFKAFWAKLKSGKNTKIEKMILNDIPNKLDKVFTVLSDVIDIPRQMCNFRTNDYRDHGLQWIYQILSNRFFKIAHESINEENKIDAVKFVELWDDTEWKPYADYISKFEKKTTEAAEKIVSGEYVYKYLNRLIYWVGSSWHGHCNWQTRQECEQVIGVSSQELTAGILHLVVEYIL